MSFVSSFGWNSVARSRCTAVRRRTRTDLRVTPACRMDTRVRRHLPRPCPGTRTTAPASTPYLKMTSKILFSSTLPNTAVAHFSMKKSSIDPKKQHTTAKRISDCFSFLSLLYLCTCPNRMSANCVTPQQSHPPKTNNNRTRVVTGKAVSRHRGLAGVKVRRRRRCWPMMDG